MSISLINFSYFYFQNIYEALLIDLLNLFLILIAYITLSSISKLFFKAKLIYSEPILNISNINFNYSPIKNEREIINSSKLLYLVDNNKQSKVKKISFDFNISNIPRSSYNGSPNSNNLDNKQSDNFGSTNISNFNLNAQQDCTSNFISPDFQEVVKINNMTVKEQHSKSDCYIEKTNNLFKKTEIRKLVTYYNKTKVEEDDGYLDLGHRSNYKISNDCKSYNVSSTREAKPILKSLNKNKITNNLTMSPIQKRSMLNFTDYSKEKENQIILNCGESNNHFLSIDAKISNNLKVEKHVSLREDCLEYRPKLNHIKNEQKKLIQNVIEKHLNQINQNNQRKLTYRSMSFSGPFNDNFKSFNEDENASVKSFSTQDLLIIENFELSNKKFIKKGYLEETFESKQIIGSGGFGRVYKANHVIDSALYAIKTIPVSIKVSDSIKNLSVLDEAKAMMRLESAFIVRYITCWFEIIGIQSEEKKNTLNNIKIQYSNSNIKKKDSLSFKLFNDDFQKSKENLSQNDALNNKENNHVNIWESKESNEVKTIENYEKNKESEKEIVLLFCIQMEYCNGVPLNYLIENIEGKFELCIVEDIFSQIVKGVNDIHQNKLIHRDLKPSNIYLTKNFQVKIGDFGLATEIQNNLEANVGTSIYQAFELGSEHYNEKVDIFALGLILFELISCFKTLSEKIEKIKILKTVLKNINENYKKEKCDILGYQVYNIYTKDEFTDFSLANVFISKNDKSVLYNKLGLDEKSSDLILTLCSYDPNLRPSSRELLDYLVNFEYFLT